MKLQTVSQRHGCLVLSENEINVHKCIASYPQGIGKTNTFAWLPTAVPFQQCNFVKIFNHSCIGLFIRNFPSYLPIPKIAHHISQHLSDCRDLLARNILSRVPFSSSFLLFNSNLYLSVPCQCALERSAENHRVMDTSGVMKGERSEAVVMIIPLSNKTPEPLNSRLPFSLHTNERIRFQGLLHTLR